MLCLSACSSLSLSESNDFLSTFYFANGASDNNFTQGLALSGSIKTAKLPDWAQQTTAKIPSLDTFSGGVPKEVGFELGQQIYTPSDLKSTEKIVGENPYAGWAYGTVSRLDYTLLTRARSTFTLGLVGPNAHGKEVQTWFHKLCDCDIPEGWDHQLRQEPTLGLMHSDELLKHDGMYSDALSVDHVDSRTINLGNVHTNYKLAREYRFGYQLPEFVSTQRKFSAFLFGSGGAAMVLRNLFYDGNSYGSNISTVDKRWLTGEARSGLALLYGGWGIRLTWIFRTKDYQQEPDELNSYGVITLGKESAVEPN